ncbi:MAG: hypothetical protein Q9O74_09400 [Planctomycetota bacterium]|nr:hypothetical protein [Planctomycetota bacterium]
MNDREQTGPGHETATTNPSGGDSWWLHGMVEQLLWVKLLRVPALALRPQRVGLAVFLVVLIGLIGNIGMPWRAEEVEPFLGAVLGAQLDALAMFWQGVLGLDGGAVASGFVGLMVDAPRLALTRYPVESVLLGLPTMAVWAVLGGALCRSVACEVSLEMTLPWTKQLAFATKRWASFLGVVLLPTVVVGAIALVLAVGGVVLFNGVPALELVGGLLFGGGLLLALLAVGMMGLVGLACPMLLPSVACEATDAIEALGRALAYVIARPLRLAVYLAIGGVTCAVAIAVAFALAEGAIGLAHAATGAWLAAQGIAELTGAYPIDAQLDQAGELREIGATARGSAWLVGFWGSCLRLVVMGYAVSCFLTAGTMVYLFMRQVCDGQHYAELWSEDG